MKNKKINLSVIILLGILSTAMIMASGVSRPYWDENPLRLAPGESMIVPLTLQNTDGEDLTMKATITSDIATLMDNTDEYLVPSGETNKTVKIKIEVPKNAEVGTKYKVVSSFRQISNEGGGMLRMVGAVTVDFPVEVVGEEESLLFSQPKNNKAILVLGIFAALIAVLAVIKIVSKKRKKVKSNKL